MAGYDQIEIDLRKAQADLARAEAAELGAKLDVVTSTLRDDTAKADDKIRHLRRVLDV